MLESNRCEIQDPLINALNIADSVVRIGRVAEAYGTLIRATGLTAKIGELCQLKDPVSKHVLLAEVVGISGNITLLTPLGSLEGVSNAMEVKALGGRAMVSVGPELLGRILDSHGHPIDGLGDVCCKNQVPVYQEAPDPLRRLAVDKPLPTGISALDAVLTIGLGQRVGIFATAGGGKSTLQGMLARGATADVNVIILVGERGREVREFIDENLGAEGLQKSIVIVATSDRPALERSRAAYVGTAIAEYFRDIGKSVLLLMDSVTRYARALREVGLALGEPPARRGFPPSVFANLPRLFERAGNNEHGNITAFYTVLLEEEGEGDDPIAEEVRSLLDGHIMLSRKLAAAAHYPAIDILSSASRVMNQVANNDHVKSASKLRQLLAKYQEIELLIQVGEYQKGTDPEADNAIERIKEIRNLLQQDTAKLALFEDTVTQLHQVVQ